MLVQKFDSFSYRLFHKNDVGLHNNVIYGLKIAINRLQTWYLFLFSAKMCIIEKILICNFINYEIKKLLL